MGGSPSGHFPSPFLFCFYVLFSLLRSRPCFIAPDIDECMELTYNCSESMDCINTAGAYQCDCTGDDIYLINGTCRGSYQSSPGCNYVILFL